MPIAVPEKASDAVRELAPPPGKIELPKSGSSVRTALLKQIIDKMKNVNSGLNDYSCPVSVKTKAKYAFLEVPFDLSGIYYYKYPDKYKVKFEKAPQFLSKYPQVFGWSLPDPTKYSGKIFDGSGEYANCFILRLVPIQGRGDMQKIELWVDRATWLFPRQRYAYKDGGFVDVFCKYRTVGGFSLFDSMNMDVGFPKSGIKATSQAIYGDYTINTGLDDSVFN